MENDGGIQKIAENIAKTNAQMAQFASECERAYRASLRPMLTMMENAQRTQEILNRSVRGLDPVRQNIQKFASEVQRIAQQTGEYYARMASAYPSWAANFEAGLARYIEAIQVELPAEFQKIWAYLSERGWFLTDDFTFRGVRRLSRMIDEGEHARIETSMQEYARSLAGDIHTRAVECWPHRKIVFDQVFKAHNEALHACSIPALLAQVDGVSRELLNESLFGKRHGDPKTKDPLDDLLDTVRTSGILVDPLTDVFFHPLRAVTSISENTQDRDAKRALDSGYGPLNRHGVQHGIDLTYPSEANGLRAILMLGYMIGVKDRLEKLRADSLSRQLPVTPGS
jgi:hypothetical protein